jgi:ATP-dependent DNA ligase
MLFDAPMRNTVPYEERLALLQHILLGSAKLTIKQIPPHSFIKVASQVKCDGRDHLKQFTLSVLNRKGEGVVLRKPASTYLNDFFTFEV